jgi:hypothetical protein
VSVTAGAGKQTAVEHTVAADTHMVRISRAQAATHDGAAGNI